MNGTENVKFVFSTGIHRLLVTNKGQWLSPAQTTTKVNYKLLSQYQHRQLTSCSRLVLETLILSQLLENFPSFYRIPKVHVCHLSLSWARVIYSMPYDPITSRHILVLTATYSFIFPAIFPVRFVHEHPVAVYRLSPPPHCAPCPGHIIILVLIALWISGKQCKLWGSPWWNRLQSPDDQQQKQYNIWTQITKHNQQDTYEADTNKIKLK
jgi:hypothetical protein